MHKGPAVAEAVRPASALSRLASSRGDLAKIAHASAARTNPGCMRDGRISRSRASKISSCISPIYTPPPSPVSSFLEFVSALVNRLSENPDEELSAAASAAYKTTLYPFHGYLSSGVFQARRSHPPLPNARPR